MSAISILDQRCALNLTPELLKHRFDLQAQFDLISNKEAERLLLRGCGSWHGNEASRLLHISNNSRPSLILSIKNTYDIITTDPIEVNATFKSFYSSLYKSKLPQNFHINWFLQNLQDPVTDSNTARQLDSSLSLEEVLQLKLCNLIKTLVPMGFQLKFFKSSLVNRHHCLLTLAPLQRTLFLTTYSALLLKDRNLTSCSYRPLSLLYASVKVLAQVIAFCLKKVLLYILSEEHNSFIDGGQLFFEYTF